MRLAHTLYMYLCSICQLPPSVCTDNKAVLERSYPRISLKVSLWVVFIMTLVEGLTWAPMCTFVRGREGHP